MYRLCRCAHPSSQAKNNVSTCTKASSLVERRAVLMFMAHAYMYIDISENISYEVKTWIAAKKLNENRNKHLIQREAVQNSLAVTVI